MKKKNIKNFATKIATTNKRLLDSALMDNEILRDKSIFNYLWRVPPSP